MLLILNLTGCTVEQRVTRTVSTFLDAWHARDGEALLRVTTAELGQGLMSTRGDHFLSVSGLNLNDNVTIQLDTKSEGRAVATARFSRQDGTETTVRIALSQNEDRHWLVSGIAHVPKAGPVPSPEELTVLVAETLDAMLALAKTGENSPLLGMLEPESLDRIRETLSGVPELFRSPHIGAVLLSDEPELKEGFLEASGLRDIDSFHLRFHLRFVWTNTEWMPVGIHLRVE